MTSALLSTLFFLLLSPHYRDTFKGIVTVLIGDFFGKYAMLLLSFLAATGNKSMRPLTRAAFLSLIILTIAGIINLLAGNDAILDIITDGRMHNDVPVGEYFAASDRFRVQSLFFSPFSYGYMCVMLLYILYYGYQNNVVSRRRLIVGLIMTLFGVVTCGCRTVLFCFVISINVYMVFRHSRWKSLLFLFLALFVLFISYHKIGVIRYLIDFLLSVFNDNSDIKGSSLELRLAQFLRVLYYIKDNWFLGRVVGFLWYDLGLQEGVKNMVDQDVKGLESVFFVYLLERGILGYAMYVLQYIIIIRYMLVHYKQCREEVSWGIAVLSAYLVFAHMTGELNSVPVTMILLGLSLRRIQDMTYSLDYRKKLQRYNRYRYRQLSV